jgi:hypothetical protein
MVRREDYQMLQRSPVEKPRAPPNKHLLNDRFIGY